MLKVDVLEDFPVFAMHAVVSPLSKIVGTVSGRGFGYGRTHFHTKQNFQEYLKTVCKCNKYNTSSREFLADINNIKTK